MFKSLLAAIAVSVAATGAQAATLSAIDLSDASKYVSSAKLFTTEMKRDRTLAGGQGGHDVFLRNAESFATPASYNVNWGASGTSYAWSLGYDGATATLAFGGVSRLLDISPDGTWNALRVYMRADDAGRFTSSAARLTVTSANGAALTAPLALVATDGQFDQAFALKRLGALTSISGTLDFSFTPRVGASGSPNGRLSVSLKALDVTPAAVPVPAALPMLATALGAMVLVRRRRKGSARA